MAPRTSCAASARALDRLAQGVDAESAIAQSAEVIAVRHHPDLGPFEGIGAILRL